MRCRTVHLIALVASVAPAAIASDFYVSPSGSDVNPGTLAAPWQTTAKVSGTSFAAGDRVHFEGGQTFAGTVSLSADDVGTDAAPITIDSYGTGRATIDGGTGDGISLYNTAGIDVSNLIIVGGWDAVRQTGNDGSGIIAYMDVPGMTKLEHVGIDGVEVSGFKQGGIVIGAWPTDGTMGGFQKVRVTSSSVHDNGEAGISSYGYWDPTSTQYAHTDVVIRRCEVFSNRGVIPASNNTGNGIVLGGVDGALIERCVAHDNGDLCDHPGGGPVGIWCWDARSVVIQYNESHHNRTGTGSGDGGGFDLDGGTTDSLVQYNYSHDNDGAGYLVYQFGGARPALAFNTVRYNVSENDARQHGIASIYMGGGTEAHDNLIHGNTVFLSPSGDPNVAAVILDGVGADNAFRNNVFVTTGGARLVSSDQAYAPTSVAFQGNAWWAGANPADFRIDWGALTLSDLASWRSRGQERLPATDTGLSVDPLLSSPGTGGTIGDADVLASLAAYHLLPGSPLIDAGLGLGQFGTDPGPTDYWGTAIPQGAGLDVGAFEKPCAIPIPGAVGDTLRLSKTTASLTFAWADVAVATSYVVREDTVVPGSFRTTTGTATSGAPGLTTAMPPGALVFYLVRGVSPCGEGPL
jgi:hypothetical protein